MKRLSVHDLKQMIGRDEPCVSIYTPLSGSRSMDYELLKHNVTVAITQAQANFRDLVAHIDRHAVDKLLAWLAAPDDMALGHSTRWKCVAYFQSSTISGFYPILEHGEDIVVVANSFHLKPLFGIIQVDPRYSLMEIGDKSIRLFNGTAQGLSLVVKLDRAMSAGSKLATYKRTLDDIADQALCRSETDRENSKLQQFFQSSFRHIRRIVDPDFVPIILVGSHRHVLRFVAANKFRPPFIRMIYTDDFPFTNDMVSLHHAAIEYLASIYERKALKGVFEFNYTRRFGGAIDSL